MTDSKTTAPLSPPPSSIQGRVQVLPPPLPTPTSPQPPLRPVPPSAPLPPPNLNNPARPKLPTPPSPATGSTSVPPKPPAMKQSILRFLPIILGVVLVVGIAFFMYRFLFGNRTTPVTPRQTNGTQVTPSSTPVVLTYWGLWEPTPLLQEVLADFEKANPNIKVSYQMQSYQDYRDRVQNAIVSGRGPDVFRFHAAWTPMLQTSLTPMPDTVYTPSQFQSTFYPSATQLLSVNGKIYGVPLMYDGLALFYNEDALRAANVQAPQTWAELKADASRLTIRSGSKIQRAGLAIGNATNTDHFSDILALLILQNGGNPSNPTTQSVIDAVTFYTNFMKTDQVWDESFPNSTVAFARGDVAMIFAPSWRIHEIKSLNPNLKFNVVPVPQLTSTKIAWSSFWAEGVSSQSKYKNEAWQLIKYLSTPEVLRKLYSTASKNRAFGELYSRQDMASELASQPYANPYLTDAPYAQGWYMSSFTHDNGLNDQIIKYYQDAITAVLGGSQPTAVLSTVAAGTSQLLRQYGVPGAASVAPQTINTP